MHAQTQYITGKKVDARYGISSMTRYRWQHNGKLSFPAPLLINRRKFWSVSALEAWEHSRSERTISLGSES
jgi:predicted DNA-binding transcriptional regulator AlpA